MYGNEILLLKPSLKPNALALTHANVGQGTVPLQTQYCEEGKRARNTDKRGWRTKEKKRYRCQEKIQGMLGRER